MNTTSPVNWGILGTGNISRAFADALAESEKNRLLAVASREGSSADKFADRYQLQSGHTHTGYEQLLADPDVQAVYVATPHPQHAEWTIRALQAGKAVLCEKPLGLNHAECMAMVQTARRNRRFLMEAFMYRLHPQTREIVRLIRDGAIGEVRHLEAQFGYHAPFDAASRLFSNDLGGGGILDVGCYPLSFARTIIGEEPETLSAHGRLGRTGVDEWAAALLHFANGVSAQISTSVSVNLSNHAVIYGSTGSIRVANPWLPADRDGNWSFELTSNGESSSVSGTAPPLYAIEADHVADCLAAGVVESAELTWQDSLHNALNLDRWRQAIGLEYTSEQPANHSGVMWHVVNPAPRISSAAVKDLQKPVARLVMGCDNQPSMAHATAMWDDYVLQGGNCFDTAHIYGGGSMETLLGHWHQQRGNREDLVIIGKGAHTPHNYPSYISSQLDISLQRLQTDYVDIYFLHRDNPDVPVGEFVEALNAEVQAGRIRCFGGSNWTLGRIRAANAYAESHGLQGFSAVSNNFSLAQMVEPIWPGVETVNSGEYQQYLGETQTALMPWSAQARGFFTPWAEHVISDNAHENTVVTSMQPTIRELKRVWFSEENFARRTRAGELADKYGVEMINIALAYVLHQPFPTFPLIGPRLLAETESCISALEIPLTGADVAYLRGSA